MAVKLQIGRYDRNIVIQKQVQSKGAVFGEPTESWVDFASVWANVYSGSGRELLAARQVSAEVTTQFQIRYIAGISPTMRILYDGLIYDIVSFSEIGRRERLDIFAKARRS